MGKNLLFVHVCLFGIVKLPFSVQDEDKKSTAGDGQSTEDESSQDSKGESQPDPAKGNADVDVPESKPEDQTDTGQAQKTSSSVRVFTRSVFIYMATNLFGAVSISSCILSLSFCLDSEILKDATLKNFLYQNKKCYVFFNTSQ